MKSSDFTNLFIYFSQSYHLSLTEVISFISNFLKFMICNHQDLKNLIHFLCILKDYFQLFRRGYVYFSKTICDLTKFLVLAPTCTKRLKNPALKSKKTKQSHTEPKQNQEISRTELCACEIFARQYVTSAAHPYCTHTVWFCD